MSRWLLVALSLLCIAPTASYSAVSPTEIVADTTKKAPKKPKPGKVKPAHPQGASAICRDGTYSYSRNRRGTCSHHGGVATWL